MLYMHTQGGLGVGSRLGTAYRFAGMPTAEQTETKAPAAGKNSKHHTTSLTLLAQQTNISMQQHVPLTLFLWTKTSVIPKLCESWNQASRYISCTSPYLEHHFETGRRLLVH